MVESNLPPEAAPMANGSPEHSQLKVLIVGAGIAGLVAAIGLRNQHHEVHLYEQSQFADEVGAAIHMGPNANSVLRRLGVDIAERGAPKLLQTRYYNSSCTLLNTVDNDAQSYRWQDSWRQAHRGHLHTQLKDRATSDKHEGAPAILHTASRVTQIDTQNATITLENGDIIQGDVVIGADGVRSATRRAIGGPEYDSFGIGKSAIRFMVPRDKVLADPETRELAEVDGAMDLIFAQEHKVIIYQCVNNTLLNIVCIHPAHQSSASTETYNKSVSKERLLDIFHEFAPKLLKLFEKCDSDTLKVYPLFDAKTMPTFVKDRLALIGDAAHPFTPFIGQGGATAIEDAVSIGVVLSQGTTVAEVPAKLELYNKARYERATKIQGYSRMAGGDGVKPGEEKAAQMKGREHAFYALSHDEHHASTRILREYEWSKLKGASWRQPTVFGPAPGPRRDGAISVTKKLKVVTASIKFKTSGTLLRNMLPNDSYSFGSKDTVVVASLTVESHQNVEWLGFHGFDRVLLSIHGVNYTKSDGSVLSASYVPVLFENSADVISAGREQTGYPSVYSDIEVDRSPGSFSARLSWNGVTWATLWMKDLMPVYDPKPTSKAIFVNRSISSTDGGPAQKEMGVGEDVLIEGDDTSETGCYTNGASTSVSEVLSSKSSSNAGFDILPRSQREIPTLHHIAARIGELPVFEVVSATVTEEEGPQRAEKACRLS